MNSYLAIAFVVCLAVMQVTSQGFNDLHRLLAMETMGLDIPDSFINYQLFRGMVPPSQGFRTNTPFTSTRFSLRLPWINVQGILLLPLPVLPRKLILTLQDSTHQTFLHFFRILLRSVRQILTIITCIREWILSFWPWWKTLSEWETLVYPLIKIFWSS